MSTAGTADALPRPIRLGVVGETELVTTGLRGMLGPHQGRVALDLLGPTSSTGHLDVVLYDPLCHEGDVRENVAKVVALGPATLLVYTWNLRAPGLDRAVAGGARGIVGKAATTDELLAVVEAAARGELTSIRPALVPYPRLSQRESEVLSLICRGLSNLEIAAELYVSVNSVKTYIRQIYQKTGSTRRTQAVAWAHAHGFDT